jgi:hypothetical protein
MKTGLTSLLRKLALAAVPALLPALAACSGDLNPVRDVAVATGIGTGPKPAPDFIASTRPETVDYARPGVAPAAFRAKTAAEVQAAEAAMDQARARNEAEAAAARQLGGTPAPAAPAGAQP